MPSIRSLPGVLHAPAISLAALCLLAPPAARADLISHWALDETSGTTATCDVNSIYNGTNTSLTANQAGKIGKAYSFNGSSSKIVPATVLPWNNNQTISAWVNRGTDASAGGRQILGWGSSSPTAYTQYRLISGKLAYFNAGAVGGSATSANVVPASSWNHVVAVKNGANVQLYINGTADGSATNLSGTMPAGTPANIGYLPGVGQGFSGGIDDVAVWNTALTAGKVRSLSTITAVLSDYSASKMDKLFQVFDGTLGSYVDGANTWLQVTGLTGHNAGDAWTDGTTYYVQLDGAGGGVSGGAFAAPTGLSAAPAPGQVTLTWTASARATGYNVKRSTTGGTETLLTTAAGSPYTDTAVTDGTTYFYVVSATAASGTIESANSSEVSATPSSAMGDQTITFTLGNTVNKTMADAPFADSATASSGLTVTYSSDNTAVATVAADGTVTITGLGTAHILADQAGNGSYNPAPQVSQTLTVSPANQTLTFTLGMTVSKTVVDVPFADTATASSGLSVTYSSDNTAVATVAADGTVTITGLGTTHILADQAGNANWNAAPQISQTLTVSLANQTLTFTLGTSVHKLTTDAPFADAATASSGLTVTYSSDNTAVATVAADGTVTITGMGVAHILANQAGNGSYNPAPQVSQTLVVDPLGLFAHWALDETSGTTATCDVSSAYNGANTSLTAGQAGKIGTAYSFNGGSSKIDPATVLPWNNIQTISAWVNRGTDASGGGRQILGWGTAIPSAAYTQYRLIDGKLQYFNAGAMGGSATSANVVPASSWNHVVAVKNGANVQLYINGTADGSATNLSGTMPAGTPANIGYLPGVGQNFLGGIDDVAVWNTALTAGKVRSLSTITAVLGDYSASKMDKLFQVFDGTLSSYNDGMRTWQQATGLTGHNEGDAWTDGTTYYVQLDGDGGGASTGSPYDTWANGSFTNTLTDKAAAHDPDGDGMTNQQEFAFGLDPTTGASVNPISHQLNKGTGIFKYTRTKNSGLTYIYQYSTTLSNPWLAFTPVTDPPAATGDPVEEVTVEVPAALLNANSKLFVRVQAH